MAASNPRLAVALIVRNAERIVQRTLDCVQPLADQVVVLDTGSHDNTPDLLRSRATTTLETEWHDDFSAARNQCLAHVRADWVLWLDAGETISSADAEQLRRFVDQDADPARAYMLRIQDPQRPGAASPEQIAQPRLLPALLPVTFEGAVHESPWAAIEQQQLIVDAVPTVIRRGREAIQADVESEKARRNVRIAAASLVRRPHDPRRLNALGNAWQTLGEARQSATYHAQAIDCSTPGSIERLEAHHGLLAALHLLESSLESRLAFGLRALDDFPLDLPLLCSTAGLLQQSDRLELAARCYETAFRYGQIQPQLWHLEQSREIAASCWAMVVQLHKSEQHAVAVLRQALNECPQATRLIRQLIHLLIKQNCRHEAERLVDQLSGDVRHRHWLREVVDAAILCHRGSSASAAAALRRIHQQGCRDPLCYRWYALALMSAGHEAELDQVLKAWQLEQPDSAECEELRRAVQDLASQRLTA